MQELIKHPRHHHYWTANNMLYESYRKSRGDLGYDLVAEVVFPDKEKLTSDDLIVIKDQLANKLIK